MAAFGRSDQLWQLPQWWEAVTETGVPYRLNAGEGELIGVRCRRPFAPIRVDARLLCSELFATLGRCLRGMSAGLTHGFHICFGAPSSLSEIPSGINRREEAMPAGKSVLVVGLDPTLIDFSQPGYLPGMNATKVFAGMKSSEDALSRLGYVVQTCLTDFGETAEAVVKSQLEQKRFDCIMIGAGVRTNPGNFILFEKLINVVHEHAPQARLCFNQLPSDIAEAVKRWV